MNSKFVKSVEGQIDQFKADKVYKRLNHLASPQDAWIAGQRVRYEPAVVVYHSLPDDPD